MNAPTRSNPTSFNPTARWLHWLMAALIVSMLFIGVGMVTSISARPWLIDLHRPLGIAILLLAVLRLRNRLRHRPPALPSTLPHWQKHAAHASHSLLYGLMLAMPVIGWAMLSAGGYPMQMSPSFVLPPILPQDVVLYAALRAAHGWLAYVLFATVLLHVSAALMHAWVYRDGSSRRWREKSSAARNAHGDPGRCMVTAFGWSRAYRSTPASFKFSASGCTPYPQNR